MRNPRTSAIVSVVGIVLIGSMMLFHGDEEPGTAVTVLQWIFLAGSVLGLVGSLIQMSKTN